MEKKLEENDINEIENPFEGKEFTDYLSQLIFLRKDGENKIIALKNEIRDVKLNKQIDKETKAKIIAKDKNLIVEAKKVYVANKEKINKIIAVASASAKITGKDHYNKVVVAQEAYIKEAKKKYAEDVVVQKKEHSERLAQIESQKDEYIKKNDLAEYKANIKAENILFASRMNEASTRKKGHISQAKTIKYEAYMAKYNYLSNLRNSHHSIDETIEYKIQTYKYNFVFKDYFLRNALYFIIILFFIVCAIQSGGNLFSWNNIRSILGQSSTKLFFSLGVAGLILIAGTDLSIGRMTGMAASFACLILSEVEYTDNFGNKLFFGDMAVAPRILLALFVCITVCVLFSALAGYFSAKFKMHPFITTLSTQLLIFGLMMVVYSNIPSFNMILDVKKSIAGANNINLIIYAIIATAIIWFIWNKTKFGKYMYAVGGNPEAASVSGISVFWVTMGIFILAGVCYGLGGFLEGVRVGAANPSTAFGTELDAIAACVVGGISFSGGVGKIRGAVIGTLIFTGMTYCLTNLGFDVNIQYIFKGVIIMAAVCLDSLKYLKRK